MEKQYLNDIWTLYFHDNSATWDNASFKNIATIGSVEDFCKIYKILNKDICKLSSLNLEYKSFDNSIWLRDDMLEFQVEVEDTISKNNLFLNLRNNRDYEFRCSGNNNTLSICC